MPKTEKGLENFPFEKTDYLHLAKKIEEIVFGNKCYSDEDAQEAYSRLKNYMDTDEFKNSSNIEKSAMITEAMFKIEKKQRHKTDLAQEVYHAGENADNFEKALSGIDNIIQSHGQPRLKDIGGGTYDMDDEFKEYKSGHREKFTETQLAALNKYFNQQKQKKISGQNKSSN